MLVPEAKAHLDQAAERLEAAKLLLSEGLFDDAVSRAYYGALYAAKAALLAEKIEPKSHDGVVLLFGTTFVKTGKITRSFGTDLARLRTLREKAEYSVAFKATETDAAWAVEAAARFVAKVEEMLGNQ